MLAAARYRDRVDRFYFDLMTSLPIRLDLWEEGPEADRRGNSGEFYLAHYQLDDYRIVDGVAVPFFIRRGRPSSAMIFRFTDVRHNAVIPDSVSRAPVQPSNR